MITRITAIFISLALVGLVGCTSLPPHPVESRTDTVVLLHGLWQTNKSMQKLEHNLLRRGFHVVNIDYSSRKYVIEELAAQVGEKISECCSSTEGKIHFITHSMGGIILRSYLKDNKIHQLGRVVMLSPPNQGCELVDKLGGNFIFNGIFGPSGKQLGTEASSVPNSLGPADFELGIITGNKSDNFLLSLLIPGKDDGRVSVKRSKIEGMDDFLVVPYGHIFIMKKPDVMEQAVYFLDNGHFKRQGSATSLAASRGAGS